MPANAASRSEAIARFRIHEGSAIWPDRFWSSPYFCLSVQRRPCQGLRGLRFVDDVVRGLVPGSLVVIERQRRRFCHP